MNVIILPPMQLLIGTNNKGKILEISEVLSGLDISILTLDEVKIPGLPEESGTTFDENALLKARYYFDRSKLPTLADDSGIIVEALRDELGLHTRRWGPGPKATDQEWIDFFLERMRHEKNKKARFVCALAYIDNAGVAYNFEGICEGTITDQLESGYLPGLPISACFKPNGSKLVYSAMSIVQKNSTSHRGRAASKFREFLKVTRKT